MPGRGRRGGGGRRVGLPKNAKEKDKKGVAHQKAEDLNIRDSSSDNEGNTCVRSRSPSVSSVSRPVRMIQTKAARKEQ